jgi:predicted lipoprotein
VSQRYTEALAAVRALEAPLERVVTTDRATLAAAAQATKALELALKVDLASALGVTITFQTGDGD